MYSPRPHTSGGFLASHYAFSARFREPAQGSASHAYALVRATETKSSRSCSTGVTKDRQSRLSLMNRVPIRRAVVGPAVRPGAVRHSRHPPDRAELRSGHWPSASKSWPDLLLRPQHSEDPQIRSSCWIVRFLEQGLQFDRCTTIFESHVGQRHPLVDGCGQYAANQFQEPLTVFDAGNPILRELFSRPHTQE